MTRTLTTIAGIAALLLVFIGCGPESATTPTPTVNMDLTVAFDFDVSAGTIPDDETVQSNSVPDGGPDSVTISSGLLMLRSIRFNTTAVSNLDTNITAGDEDNDVNDASVRYQGPGIVTIGRNATDLGTIELPIGTYEQATFVLQRARESDNLGIHDELLGSSVRVEGKVWRGNTGQAFVYQTDYTAEMAVTGQFNVTTDGGTLELRFSAGDWFYNGARWLDPNEPANRTRIVRCIERNMSGGTVVD